VPRIGGAVNESNANMDVSPLGSHAVSFYSTPIKVPFTIAKVDQPAMVRGNDALDPWVTYAAGTAPSFGTPYGQGYSYETTRGIIHAVPNDGNPWSGAPEAPPDNGPPSSDNPTVISASQDTGTEINVIVVAGPPPAAQQDALGLASASTAPDAKSEQVTPDASLGKAVDTKA
jgi:hypothetical protein